MNDQHTYHPHWRFDFDLDGAGHDDLEYFADGGWQRVEEEGWFPHTGESDDDGFVWRQIDFGTGSAVNLRPHTWDDAELFAVRYHDGEWAGQRQGANGLSRRVGPCTIISVRVLEEESGPCPM